MIIPDGKKTTSLDAALIAWINKFAPYGVIATDRDFRIQSWNKWMEQHSNLPSRDVLDRNIFELYPALNDRRLFGLFERALTGEVSFLSTALHGYLLPLPPVSPEADFEFMQQTARIGPLVVGEVVCGVIVVIEDVTQREWQAAILRRQHERDEILSWALGHLLKTDDPRRTIRDLFCKVAEHLDFNTYLLYLCDSPSGSLRLHASGGVDPEDQQELWCLPAGAPSWISSPEMAAPHVAQHVQLHEPDSFSSIPHRMGIKAYVSFPLRTGGELLGVLCFATHTRDTIQESEIDLITTLSQYLAVALSREKTGRELREAKDKLNEHAQTLEKAVAERTHKLREIIAELETFSYTVAHDLRAPIRSLTGYAEVLKEDYGSSLPAEAHRVLDKLSSSAKRLDDLTIDLLEFSKISRQDIKLAPVNVEEVLQDALTVSISQEADVLVQRPLHTVTAHRLLLQQCLMNLIENGVKFVRPGSRPKIRIWTEAVSASGESLAHVSSPFSRSLYSLHDSSPAAAPAHQLPPGDGARVRIWVEDEGIGISPEAQRRIFGIFERGAITTEYSGTGIGLAIVTRAAERMGGTCGVDSEEGGGSRFWLELPKA